MSQRNQSCSSTPTRRKRISGEGKVFGEKKATWAFSQSKKNKSIPVLIGRPGSYGAGKRGLHVLHAFCQQYIPNQREDVNEVRKDYKTGAENKTNISDAKAGGKKGESSFYSLRNLQRVSNT